MAAAAHPKAARPFIVPCRDATIGSAGAKLVYLVAASYCDQYPKTDTARAMREHGEATCYPSLETLRAKCGGMGRTAFHDHWRYLRKHGYVGTRCGSNVKVIRTPTGAARAGRQAPRSVPDDAPQRRPGWRQKRKREVPESGTTQRAKVPDSGTSRSTAFRYITRSSDSAPKATAAAPVAIKAKGGRAPGAGRDTNTASHRPGRPSPSARPDRDSDPDWLRKGEVLDGPSREERTAAAARFHTLFHEHATRPAAPATATGARPSVLADVHIDDPDELAAATARALAPPVASTSAPPGDPHLCPDCGAAAGLTCPKCGRGTADAFAPSADWNGGH